MRSMPLRHALRSTVALGAVVLASAEAQAACTTVNGVVTCTGPSTVDEVNAALNRTPPPSVTLVVEQGATVTNNRFSGFAGTISPGGRFVGAVGYVNSGVVGSTSQSGFFFSDPANVNFTYNSFAPRSTANTFNLANRGTQNGSISAFNVGGAITATNSGLITNGLTLRGSGPITFANTGTIQRQGFFFFDPAVTLVSSLVTQTQGADGTFRSTETGGPIVATIGGTIGFAATANVAARPQDVQARSVGGVDVTVTGNAGGINADSRGNDTTQQFTTTRTPFTFTDVFATSGSATGAASRVTVAQSGSVANVQVGTGVGAASAVISGLVSDSTNNRFNGVNVTSTGFNSAERRTTVFDTRLFFPPESANTSFRTNTGGNASVDITATGRVAGMVSVFSNAGAATANVAGQIGAATRGAELSIRSTGMNTTFDARSVSRADGTSDSNFASSSAASGGAASATVAATGQVFGSLTVQGDASAALDNAGRIAGFVSVNSQPFANTTNTNNSSRTIATNAAGVRTVVDRSASSEVLQQVGGTASVVNRLGATVLNRLTVSGSRGATLDNAGTIQGSVDLLSRATRSESNNTDIRTSTTTPATGGGTTTTFVQDVTTNSSQRSTGGVATGTYSGTVGVARPTQFFDTFTNVQQQGATASTATVTGTIFGNFTGSAGATDTNNASTRSTRQITQPSGASTRDTADTSREVRTQIASTSTLTVGPTGRIVSNGFFGGNVNLNSAGGNATFTLDGGQTGNVNVEGASGTNVTRTTASTASFTRAAPVPGQFTPEVQQSQTNTTTSDTQQATGTGIANVNSGLIVGDLSVRGSGTGAGSLGASVVQNGTVTGNVLAFSSGANDRSTSTSTTTRTGPAAVTRTLVDTTVSAPSGNAGGVLVAANGTTGGGIFAGADAGNVTVNLGGTVGSLSAEGVSLSSFDFTTRRETTTTSAGTSFFDLRPTASTLLASTTVTGGTATLNVAPNAGTRNIGASSIEGDIFVQGFAGSALNLAAGSQILQSAGRLFVGTGFLNSTTRTDTTFTGGVQSGSTTTQTATLVGGPTTLTNAGVIGSAANQVSVDLFSLASTTATNTGTINGSIRATTQNANRTTSIVTTNANVPATRRTVTTTTFTGAGGPTSVNNAGLVTGGITVSGSTGLVTNSGVVRGAVTLGEDPLNFTRTTTTTTSATGAPVTTTTTTAPATLFAQTYTLNQNGLLVGGVNVAGTRSSNGAGGTIRTGSVNATVNLNNGSVTLGNITGNADATTNVNLNGSGFLGIAINDFLPRPVLGQPATAFSPAPALGRFTAIDPTIGTTANLPTGSRVSGVQTLTKSGDGTFVIVGSPLLPAFGTAPANFTLDVGTLRINGGELQLGLAGVPGDAFGIRGNVENNANLVLGRRITNGAQSAVLGTNISVLGNVTNAAAGNLVVGFNPSFVQSGSALVPFVLGSPGLASTNSFLRVDGNLSLAGNVAVQGISGALYEAGRAQDLFSVSGTFANTGTVRSNFASPFVGFTLTPRSEGGRTIVSLGVVRNAFNTVTTDDNARAAANSFQAALPSIFGGIRSGANAADTQDLARIVTLLDTQLNADQANQVFRELSSGEFYGSLAAVSTTVPFGEATDGLTSSVGDDEAGEGKSGIGLWFRPTGQSAKFKRDDRTGASEIDVLNYGGSIGLNYSTGAGGSFGIAAGYGKLDVDATSPERAKADTIMVGIYAAQQFGGLHLSGQAVYGKSEWDVSRTLSLLGRRATASFDSEEIRANARIAYTIAPLPGLDISPFAKVEARRYDFDGFTETGAGAVSLVVAGRAKTIVSPEVGVRMAGAVGEVFRPFAEASYVFNGDVGSDRRMGFTGNRVQDFTTRGVDPQESIKGAIGVVADVALGTVFVRGDYASGGQQQVGSVRGGVLFKF